MPLQVETLRASATGIAEATVAMHHGQPGSLSPDELSIPARTGRIVETVCIFVKLSY